MDIYKAYNILRPRNIITNNWLLYRFIRCDLYSLELVLRIILFGLLYFVFIRILTVKTKQNSIWKTYKHSLFLLSQENLDGLANSWRCVHINPNRHKLSCYSGVISKFVIIKQDHMQQHYLGIESLIFCICTPVELLYSLKLYDKL